MAAKKERRTLDPRIDHLHDCVEGLKTQVSSLHGQVSTVQAELQKNTEVTQDVRDILASFRVVGAIAKWTAGVGAAATALYHGLDWIKK